MLVAAGLTACRFDADYGGTRLRCSGGARCPDGFVCAAGVCTDAPLDGPGGPDAGACELAAQAPDNDGCGAAIDLTAAARAAGGATAYGDTTGYAGDLTPATLPGCTGAPEPGPDAVYRLDLAAGETVRARLETTGWTGALYLLDGCGATAACQGGATGADEAVIAVAAADTYYLVVDAPGPSAGCFTLRASVMR